jgi:HD-GYP domain-containing protein (c-di-GMP phosphodiesterase class II)
MMENTEGLCRAIREEGLLIRLLDGELQTGEENKVLAHLRACHECLGVVADLLSTDSRLRDLFSRQEHRKEKAEKEKREERRNGSFFMLEVDKLPVGKKLDRDLMDNEGKLLVASGTTLTAPLVDSIKRRGIEKLAVKTAEEIEVPEVAQIEIPPVSIREIDTFIAEGGLEPAVSEFVRKKCRESVESCFKSLENEGTFSLGDAEDSAAEVVTEILSRPNLALTISDMILVDPSLHAHSVNVLVLFLIIARAMGHPGQLIRDHSTAALLHDIGRIVFRRAHTTSGLKLSPKDEDLEHTETGYAYLWNFGGFGQSALKMVMNHHERYDGKGYPRALKGTNLTDWDQLLILANTFDNLTWNRQTGIRSGFHDALSSMIQNGSKYVRKGIITAAVQTFGYYPPGSWVKLNNGEIGIVSKSHPGSPLKPVVSVFFSEDNRRLSKPKIIDLGYSSSAYIQSSVSVGFTP